MIPLSIICFCLPTLLLAAPLEDGLKNRQQNSNSDSRSEMSDLWLWHMINGGVPSGHPFHLRSLDSLGHGNILRSLDDDYEMFRNGPRLVSNKGVLRGGLDSLGHGNILRSVQSYYDDIYPRSLDSLGHGNILKRSTRN